MGVRYNPLIVTNGLLAYWDAGNTKSYPGSGSAWYDLTGNGNTGTLTGPTYAAGVLNFNGTSNYVDATGSAFTSNMSAYSICYYANRTVGNRMPVSSISTTFYWFGDNSWAYNHGGVQGEYYYPKSVTISDGSWGFFCCTYDGSFVKIFRNQTYEGQQATTGTANWSTGMRIGYWSSSTYAWSGKIASVSFYNRALSQSEVSQNYNALKGRFGL